MCVQSDSASFIRVRRNRSKARCTRQYSYEPEKVANISGLQPRASRVASNSDVKKIDREELFGTPIFPFNTNLTWFVVVVPVVLGRSLEITWKVCCLQAQLQQSHQSRGSILPLVNAAFAEAFTAPTR
jgi:hypothetical protein